MRTLLVVAVLAGVVSVSYQPAVSAACGKFLTFPTWYDGLVDNQTSCQLKPIGNESGEVSLQKFITLVILNIVEMVLQLIAYAAVVFLIVGGFRYLTSAGDSNLMSAAKKTITNAIIGLVIAIFSAAIVNAVAGAF